MSRRAEALAERIARGHRALIDVVEALPEEAWQTECANEGRTVGVLVHHLATVLPGELNMIRAAAAGQPVTGITPDILDELNARHAEEYAACGREETMDLLRRNSALMVSAVRELTDAELDRAVPVSLHWDAPVTAQYLIEDHPLAHAYHHLASIRAAVGADKPLSDTE
jgi:uncharacterized damage-inducible protein DinB